MIAASKSVVSSGHFKKVLEIILAFGNYMNSSRRGGAFGFKLQSLDVVSITVHLPYKWLFLRVVYFKHFPFHE